MSTKSSPWGPVARTRIIPPTVARPVVFLGLVLGCLLLPVAPLHAQTKYVDERRFAVYMLEELYRDIQIDANDVQPGYLWLSANKSARQKLQLELLRHHIEKMKNPDEELLNLVRSCGERRELTVQLMDDLKKLQDETFANVYRIVGKQQADRNMATLNTFGFGLAAVFGDADDTRDALRGLFATAANEAMRQPGRAAEVNNAVKAATAAFNMKKAALIEKALGTSTDKDLRQEIEKLGKKLNWKDVPEFNPSWKPGSDNGLPREGDPFRLYRHVTAAVADKKFGKDDKTPGQSRLALARQLRKAIDWLPPDAGDKLYEHYRRMYLEMAGMLANQSAGEEVGETGFTGALRKTPAAAELAVSIWSEYVTTYQRPETEPTGELLRQYFLAHAYNGSVKEVYQKIRTNTAMRPLIFGKTITNPIVFYDLARLSCVGANDNKSPYLSESAQYLAQAVRLGFKNTAQARVSPDLKKLDDVGALNRILPMDSK